MVFVRCSVPFEISSILNEVPQIFQNIEIMKGGVDAIFENDGSLRIMLDKDDYFVKNNDSRGIKVLVLHRLNCAFSRKRFGYEGIANDVISYRKIANYAPSDLEYYFYVTLSRKGKKISSVADMIEINMPWMSFHGGDVKHFMKEMIQHFQVSKETAEKAAPLLDAMSKDLRQRENYLAFRKLEAECL